MRSPSRTPATAAAPAAVSAPTSAPGCSFSSPRAANTVNSSTTAMSMCISEPALMTSMRRG